MPSSDAQHDPAGRSALDCVFTLLGKRWNGVIIAALLHGPLGFAERGRSVPGISDSMLSARVAELNGAGILRRQVLPGPPISVTYHLTDAGLDLGPALIALTTWARAHFPDRLRAETGQTLTVDHPAGRSAYLKRNGGC